VDIRSRFVIDPGDTCLFKVLFQLGTVLTCYFRLLVPPVDVFTGDHLPQVLVSKQFDPHI
jgi:hypothetical protein